MKKNNPKWQSELRHKLEREAFNKIYKCYICGSHENLHIHHLVYSTKKDEYFDPTSWVILCASCHSKTPKDCKKITGSTNDDDYIFGVGWENFIRKNHPNNADYLIDQDRKLQGIR